MESQDGGRNGSRTQAERKLFDDALAGKRSGLGGLDREMKKALPWTEEEHRLFLLGLKKYGKGDWRNISRNFVITRTPTQVASHAQNYLQDKKKKNVIVTRSRL